VGSVSVIWIWILANGNGNANGIWRIVSYRPVNVNAISMANDCDDDEPVNDAVGNVADPNDMVNDDAEERNDHDMHRDHDNHHHHDHHHRDTNGVENDEENDDDPEIVSVKVVVAWARISM